MKTTKPTSTISYNSRHFLVGTLQRLMSNELIQFWAIIRHEPEEDENKAHWHVYIEPAKALDVLWLRKQFQEFEVLPAGAPQPKEKKALGCLPFNKSKWVDWYWYGIHDSRYLAMKGESRKYHYEPSDVVTPDEDYFAELVRTNPCPASQIAQVSELIDQGYSAIEIADYLHTSMARLGYVIQAVEYLEMQKRLGVSLTYRAGKPNHEASTPKPVARKKPRYALKGTGNDEEH